MFNKTEKHMRKKQTNTVKVLQYIKNNPNAKAKEVSKATGVPVSGVYQTVYLQKKKVDNKSVYQKPSTLAPNAVASMTLFADDKVNSPSHYKVGGIETIDFIEAKGLDYHLGNVVKYISRAEYKDDKLENLKKAQWYLNRAVENLSKT
jgi:hypothetical protein